MIQKTYFTGHGSADTLARTLMIAGAMMSVGGVTTANAQQQEGTIEIIKNGESVTLSDKDDLVSFCQGNTEITSVTINDNSTLTSLSDNCFKSCTALQTVKLPSQFTKLGSHVFDGCTSLETINLQDTKITELGDYCFNNCPKYLVNLPKTIKTIGDNCFAGDILTKDGTDSPLHSSDVPNLESIGAQAFMGCSVKYLVVDLPATLSHIGEGAFKDTKINSFTISADNKVLKELPAYCLNNSKLESFSIPDCIEKIGDHCVTFGEASLNYNSEDKRNTIILPANLVEMGVEAFENSYTSASQGPWKIVCQSSTPPKIQSNSFDDNLRKLYISAVEVPTGSIDTYKSSDWGTVFSKFVTQYTDGSLLYDIYSDTKEAFALKYCGKQGIDEYDVPSTVNGDYTVVNIGQNCFYRANIKTIRIPNTVSDVQEGAFSRGSMENIIFEKGSPVKKIKGGTFDSNDNLKNLVLPDALETLDVRSMAYTGKNLTRLVIPASIKEISDYSISQYVKEIWFLGNNLPERMNVNDRYGETDDKPTLYVFKSAMNNFSSWTKNNVNPIYSETFTDENGISYTATPKENENGFDLKINGLNADHRVNIVINDRVGGNGVPYDNMVKALPDNMFKDSDIKSVVLSKSVETIGKSAFLDCSNLVSVSFADDSQLKTIGASAFQNDAALESVKLPSGVTNVPSFAFAKCSNLLSVELPEGLTEINMFAFQDCSNLAEIAFPSSLAKLGDRAFTGTALASIELPASIGNNSLTGAPFEGCPNLVTARLHGDLSGSSYGLVASGNTAAQQRITLNVEKEYYDSYAASKVWKNYNIPNPNFVYFDDGSKLANGTYKTGWAHYSREIPSDAQYVTLCLPCDIKLSDVKDSFEEVYVSSDIALNNGDNGLLLMLDKKDMDEDVVKARTPMFIKTKTGVESVVMVNSGEFTVDDNTYTNDAPTQLKVYDWDGKTGLMKQDTTLDVRFGGAMSAAPLTNGYTIDGEGVFGKSDNVVGYRAYVTMSDATAQRVSKISIGVDGHTTGICVPTITSAPTATDNCIYTISGSLVNTTGDITGLAKGIYIKNNKKIIIK